MADGPAPSFSTTYRRADGEPIDEHGWVTELDWFEDHDEPIELVREDWTRAAVSTFWLMPTHLYSCTKVDECDEDAVAWEQQPDGGWAQTSAEHAAPA